MQSDAALVHARPAEDWRRLLVVFWVTSLVEGIGVSQVFALLPTALREMGVPVADRLAFIGLFSALIFVVGAPLVPLWGAWADRYSRKAVIVRSALVEALVFLCAALSREPWQLALTLMLIGFQLGNTGVMLAGLRDVTPPRRLGTVIGLFGASGPVGFALGPIVAGALIDGLGRSVGEVFLVSMLLSLGTAALVAFGTREVRPEVIPAGPILRLAFGAIRGALADPVVRRLFLIYGVVFLATQMSRPYTPVIVEDLVGTGAGLASAIGLVMGTASLVGALTSPGSGWIGDRIGFRPVLIVALAAGAVVSPLMPFAPELPMLAALAVVLGAAAATVGAMVLALLATEVPPERRSATLNLVYLPLYVAGVIGPATGGVVAAATGSAGPFVAGGIVFALGALGVAVRRRTSGASHGAPSVEYDPGMRTGVPPSAEHRSAPAPAAAAGGSGAARRPDGLDG
ncbi:MAG TPA: MFS transporter [Candidatus Limnocylindrales bacterium]|nr:MFS transporter [Candidatus Limnocylindrales bacterium]